jgi:glucosamine-6-phosphate deaminase
MNHCQLARGSSYNGHFSPLKELIRRGDADKDYDILMKEFYNAFVNKEIDRQKYIESVVFVRAVKAVWNINTSSNDATLNALIERIDWIEHVYLVEHKPGDSVPKEIQLLKGRMRESEVDRVWALSRMPMDRIFHLRSKFYTDDFFAPQPTLYGDAKPMADLIVKLQPQLISVAFDPEGTGPDTHYKVLQIVAAALKMAMGNTEFTSDPLIWGYRNVWFMFTPSDATIMIPGSASDLDLMNDTFMSCFTTQKDASFPSPSYEGPFSAWASHIQKEQRKDLGVLIGEDWFQNHEVDAIRNSASFVFIKAMKSSIFLNEVEELKVKIVGNT